MRLLRRACGTPRNDKKRGALLAVTGWRRDCFGRFALPRNYEEVGYLSQCQKKEIPYSYIKR